ncbi:hypothetical protein AW736_23645 [Termitidicoccus mucosus]|uniref:Autotransporter domain-containing protein n=1 Tax=Termitidicoccus mucosus TaxID=1184151 RepID=A0A178IB39_9BACT|nr:hypothetical protein AW736_23645 [Opitutaceae bacterium TSB47]
MQNPIKPKKTRRLVRAVFPVCLLLPSFLQAQASPDANGSYLFNSGTTHLPSLAVTATVNGGGNAENATYGLKVTGTGTKLVLDTIDVVVKDKPAGATTAARSNGLMVAHGGELTAGSGTIDNQKTTGNNYGIRVQDEGSVAWLGNLVIVTSASSSANGTGALGGNGGTLHLADSDITIHGYWGKGVTAFGNQTNLRGYVYARNLTIHGLNTRADAMNCGYQSEYGGYLEADGGTVETFGGASHGVAVVSAFNTSANPGLFTEAHMRGITFTLHGDGVAGGYVAGYAELTLDACRIAASGSANYGLYARRNSTYLYGNQDFAGTFATRIVSTDTEIVTTGRNSAGAWVKDAGVTVEIVRGVIATGGADAAVFEVLDNGNVIATDAVLSSAQSHGIYARTTGSTTPDDHSTVTVRGGSLGAGRDLVNVDGALNGGNFNTALDAALDRVATVNGGNIIRVYNHGTVNFSGSSLHLTGAMTLGDRAADVANVTLDATDWTMTSDSAVTRLTLGNSTVRFAQGGAFRTLDIVADLTGSGTFVMNTDIAANTGDQLTVGGTAGGAHRIIINDTGARPTGGEPPLLLVQTAAGTAAFSGTTTIGLYDYSVQNGAQFDADGITGLPATNWYLYRAGLSATADAIIGTAAMLGRDWHYSLDALYLRMGDVRAELLPAAVGPDLASGREYVNPSAMGGATQGRALHRGADARSPQPAGNIWMRARGYRLNADNRLTGRAFDEYVYGLTTGGDKAFRHDGSTTLLGGFVDLGRIERDFSRAGGTGHTNGLTAGLYGTWLHDAGWHADLVLKADRYKHRFDTLTADGGRVQGGYSSDAQGVSLEAGRRLERADGWWVEPTAQAAVAWLRGATYRSGSGHATFEVKAACARAAQYRALVRFGRRIADSKWIPYGKFGVVKTDTAGGAVRLAGEAFVPDYDGWRAEAGVGATYRVSGRSQLYFDYEYSKAARYERPWSLNFGCRRLW